MLHSPVLPHAGPGEPPLHACMHACMQLVEPATDLAVALAVAASYFERPIPRDLVAIGEIGAHPHVLAGHVCMHAPLLHPTGHAGEHAHQLISACAWVAGAVVWPLQLACNTPLFSVSSVPGPRREHK